ncbi:thioesterase II family protein [Loktanella agnita]|uniref:thioesterase II family protein n=1 Tax=Loktanella agnita TaxID=287097 RepID=UPI0039872E31
MKDSLTALRQDWLPSWAAMGTDNPTRIVCFPFAGGSAIAWTAWCDDPVLGAGFLPYELPGRGARFGQGCVTNRALLVDQIAEDLRPFCVDGQQLVLMGHSMGATLAYEVGLRLGGHLPLILSGRAAPGLGQPLPIDLSDAALTARLMRYGGTLAEILQCQELLDILLPTMRADYMLLQSQTITGQTYAGPVLVLGGADDDTVSQESLAAWDRYCPNMQVTCFPGGHFFVQTAMDAVKRRISDWLATF